MDGLNGKGDEWKSVEKKKDSKRKSDQIFSDAIENRGGENSM